MNKISVILRNRNEGEFIGFTLQSLVDHIPDAEIIILDNNSTDDSLEVVSLFNERADIRNLTVDTYTPGKSLNFGINQVSNPVTLIISGHSQITKFNLNYLESELEKHVAVFGNQIPIYRGKKISKRYVWSHFIDEPVINMVSKIENRPFLHNAFCFYRTEYLLENPFDSKLSGKEDRYWAEEVIKRNDTYLYTPILEVNHYYTQNGATWKGLG